MSNTLEFMKNVLLTYEESQRQTGRTTYLIQKAKETDSVFVCHNRGFANMILDELDEFDVEAISLDTYLSDEYHRGRKKRTFIFDHFCEYELIKIKLEEVEKIMKNGLQRRLYYT